MILSLQLPSMLCFSCHSFNDFPRCPAHCTSALPVQCEKMAEFSDKCIFRFFPWAWRSNFYWLRILFVSSSVFYLYCSGSPKDPGHFRPDHQGLRPLHPTSYQSTTPMQTVPASTIRNAHSIFVEQFCPLSVMKYIFSSSCQLTL